MVRNLLASGIPYMVTGSYASTLYGDPRATNDVDLIIEPTVGQIEDFVKLLEEHEYVSVETAKTAVATNSMFNVIDTDSGWKVDFIIRKSRDFSIEEFRRRKAVDVMGAEIFVVSPEDSILSKLEWSKKSQSVRQLRDVESVAMVQWKNLDIEYLKRWARELLVEDELNQILEQAQAWHDEDR